jgi:tetratricopeptide (TPR) repeat protein
VGIFSLSLAAAQAATAAPSRGDSADPAAAARPRARLGARGVVGAALVVSVVAMLALFLSDAFIQRARTVVDNPRAELSAARSAALFDPWSVTPHYLEASATETIGSPPAAFGQLNNALSLEPDNSATLGVLGDFEARGRHFAAARAYYRRALALNPLDTGLQQLARIGEPRARSRHT